MAEKKKSGLWFVLTVIVLSLVLIGVLIYLEVAAGPRELQDRYVYKPLKPDNIEMPVSGRQKISLRLDSPRHIEAGSDGNIYVACCDAIAVLDGDKPGKILKTIKTGRTADCLAVDSGGAIYTCCGSTLRRLDKDGAEQMQAKIPGRKFYPSDIVVKGDVIFIADSGRGLVLRFDTDGEFLTQIPDKTGEKGFDGFVIPSPFMSLAVISGGRLCVTNTGKHRIEVFDSDGTYRPELCWGKFSHTSPEGFAGCCNPVSISTLGGKYVVTVEKSTPRVKLYNADGKYVGLVASTERLAPASSGMTAACLADNRIFVLNPASRTLHVTDLESTGFRRSVHD